MKTKHSKPDGVFRFQVSAFRVPHSGVIPDAYYCPKCGFELYGRKTAKDRLCPNDPWTELLQQTWEYRTQRLTYLQRLEWQLAKFTALEALQR